MKTNVSGLGSSRSKRAVVLDIQNFWISVGRNVDNLGRNVIKKRKKSVLEPGDCSARRALTVCGCWDCNCPYDRTYDRMKSTMLLPLVSGSGIEVLRIIELWICKKSMIQLSNRAQQSHSQAAEPCQAAKPWECTHSCVHYQRATTCAFHTASLPVLLTFLWLFCPCLADKGTDHKVLTCWSSGPKLWSYRLSCWVTVDQANKGPIMAWRVMPTHVHKVIHKGCLHTEAMGVIAVSTMDGCPLLDIYE